MSFILDALKKSEAERLRKGAPGLASIPESGRQKSSSKWIWLVLGLIAINLAVLAGLLFRAEQPPVVAEMPVASAVDPVNETAAASSANSGQSLPAVAGNKPVTIGEQPRTDPALPGNATATPQSKAVDEGLETFNDLRAKGILQLPDMHLDIHVYSGQPADRFVFVNMSKYKENATLTEGPVVTEITPFGVVLSYQGIAFLLPRE